MDTSKNKTVKAAFSADEANAITNNIYRAIHAKYPRAKVTVVVTALGIIKVSLNSAPFPVFADGTGNGESDNFRLGMGKNMAGRRYSPEMVKFWNVVLQEVRRLVPGEPVKIFYIGFGRGGYRIIGGARKRLTAKRLDAAQTPLERLRANYAKEKQKLEAMLKASEALFIYGTVLTARFSLGQGQEDGGDWSVHVSLDTRELPPVRGNCSDIAAAEPAVAALKNAVGKVPAEWKQIKDTFSKMNAQAGKLNALLNQIRKIRAQMD